MNVMLSLPKHLYHAAVAPLSLGEGPGVRFARARCFAALCMTFNPL
jgi:hypothetical protein